MNKFKQVLITWGIVYVLITALIYLLNQLLIDQPIYFRTLVLSGIMVFALQYLIFPAINKLKNKLKIVKS